MKRQNQYEFDSHSSLHIQYTHNSSHNNNLPLIMPSFTNTYNTLHHLIHKITQIQTSKYSLSQQNKMLKEINHELINIIKAQRSSQLDRSKEKGQILIIGQSNCSSVACFQQQPSVDPLLLKQTTFKIENMFMSINKLMHTFNTCLLQKNNIMPQLSKMLETFKEDIDKGTKQISSNINQIKKQFKTSKENITSYIKSQLQILKAETSNLLTQQHNNNAQQLLKNIFSQIEKIKSAVKTKHEHYQKEIKFLKTKNEQQQKDFITILSEQNKFIEGLKQNIEYIKEVHDHNIHIPIMEIRESVQKELEAIKNEIEVIKQNGVLDKVVSNLQYLKQKILQGTSQKVKGETNGIQSKNIILQLSQINTKSLTTIASLETLIQQEYQQIKTVNNYSVLQKGKSQSIGLIIQNKRKLQNEQIMQMQKEYIARLQGYNASLQQSILRTKVSDIRELIEAWAEGEKLHKERYNQVKKQMERHRVEEQAIFKQLTAVKHQLLYKSNKLNQIRQSLDCFKSEIVSISALKQEISDLLTAELNMKQQIYKQVDAFNIFTRKADKVHQIHSIIPQYKHIHSQINPQQHPYFDQLLKCITKQHSYRQQEETITLTKRSHQSKLKTISVNITKLHKDLLQFSKKARELTIVCKDESIKKQFNSLYVRLQDVGLTNKIMRQSASKNVNKVEEWCKELMKSDGQIRKILKNAKIESIASQIQQIISNKSTEIANLIRDISFSVSSKDQGSNILKQTSYKHIKQLRQHLDHVLNKVKQGQK